MAKGVKGSTPNEENKSVKTSFIMDPLVMKKVRYMALMEEKEITAIVNNSLLESITKYEKKNGPIPEKK